MKDLILLAGIVCYSFLFSQCSSHRNSKIAGTDAAVVENELSEAEEGEEKEDGIREAQEMEFERTKDISLGYVPKDRLVLAYNNLLMERRSGINNRISALSWIERGPNTDVVGPSNGNTRGPGNNAVTGGRMRAILVDLADATNHTVWAASVSGGLWKTTDISASPATWQLVNDFLGNLAVTSICQSPVNTNIMYFGTGEMNGNIGAVRGGGIWKSTDHGVTWNLLPNTTGFYNVSKIACDAAGNLYVGTVGSGAGLQRSNDGGATWIEITPSTSSRGTRITDIKFSNTGRMHVTKGFNGSPANTAGYFYTDNPASVDSLTWTTPLVPFSTQYNCEMAVAGNTLYMLPSNSSWTTPQIYKSMDGGATWLATATSPPSGTSDSQISPSINTGQGWYDLAIGVDPNDPNIVIAGGLNFYRSQDGGNTWNQISRWVGTSLPYVHADHHIVVWKGNQILMGTDGGIFYSTDYGNSFSDRNVGLRIKQFYSCAIHPITTNYFLAGAQDNGTHQLINAGLGGSVEVLGGDGGFTHIDEDEPQYQFAATTSGNYRRSTNGGSSWSSVSNPLSSQGQFINPTDYDDANNRMYTGAAAGAFIRWDNPQTGNSFSSVSISAASSGSVISIKVSPYTNNLVFFGSSNGRIVKVENAHTAAPTVSNISGSSMPGSTVSSVNVGTSDNFLIATFSNYSSLLNHVWMSSTGGGAAGWTNISGNLPDIPVRWAMFYPENNDKAIIATDMGVFETDDINGASTVWVQNSTFPTVRTEMLQYRFMDNTVIAATHGRGLWTASLAAAAPYIRFASGYNFTTGAESTTATGSVCRNYKDYTVNMHIDQAPTSAANVTLNIASGTATQGVDYDFTTNGSFTTPSNVVTFPSGSTADQPVTIRVYNDTEVEAAESFVFSYTIGGGTNALAAPSSQSFTFNINDNDVAPVPTVYNGNFALGTSETNLDTETPFRSNKSKFRIQYLFSAAELNAAGITGAGNITSMTINVLTKNSTQPYNGFTIAMGNTTATNMFNVGFVSSALTQVYTGNYSSVPGINNFNFSTPFVWDGTSNVVVNFCFDNGSTVESLADVVDGTTAPFPPIGTTTVYATSYSNLIAGSGCSLGVAFVSPARITTTFGAISGNPIASALNVNRTEYVGNNGNYYFYNSSDIINSIANSSANLGCVTSNIFEAGNTWQSIYAGQRSQKVIDVALTSNNTATYTIGLYYTAAELGGKSPGVIKIAGTTAATMAGASSSNTVISATSFTVFVPGYLFTATVTGSGKYFLVEDNATGIFTPANRPDNFARLLQNPVTFSIPLFINNESRTNVSATLFTNTGQLLKRWDLGRTDGNVILPFSGSLLTTGTYLLRIDAGNKTQSFKLIKQ